MAVLLLLLCPEPTTQHCRDLPGTAGTYSTLFNTGQSIKQRLVSASIKLVAMSRAVCDALISVWSKTQYSSLMVREWTLWWWLRSSAVATSTLLMHHVTNRKKKPSSTLWYNDFSWCKCRQKDLNDWREVVLDLFSELSGKYKPVPLRLYPQGEPIALIMVNQKKQITCLASQAKQWEANKVPISWIRSRETLLSVFAFG